MKASKFNDYRIEGDCTYLLLESRDKSKTLEAIISTSDLKSLIEHKRRWHAIKKNGCYYVRHTKPSTYLHRYLLGSCGLEVDHINRKPLDNRRENLRPVSREINSQNKGLQSNNKSGVKGVWWDSRARKWAAKIGYQSRKMHLGYFENLEEASKAYAAAAELFHPFNYSGMHQ